MNEGARIEACASGGRMLASKSLIERVAPDDAAALGIDPDRVSYVPLAWDSRFAAQAPARSRREAFTNEQPQDRPSELRTAFCF
jgi:hypothetical protein